MVAGVQGGVRVVLKVVLNLELSWQPWRMPPMFLVASRCNSIQIAQWLSILSQCSSSRIWQWLSLWILHLSTLHLFQRLVKLEVFIKKYLDLVLQLSGLLPLVLQILRIRWKVGSSDYKNWTLELWGLLIVICRINLVNTTIIYCTITSLFSLLFLKIRLPNSKLNKSKTQTILANLTLK